MGAPLKRVLVCAPQAAGWGRPNRPWRELGYLHEPDGELAGKQHARLAEVLESAGAEVRFLDADESLGLDAVYAHDASFPTDAGMILMHPGKAARRGEPSRQELSSSRSVSRSSDASSPPGSPKEAISSGSTPARF